MSRLHETNVKLKTGKTDKCLNKTNVELRKRLPRLNKTNVEVEKRMSRLNKRNTEIEKRRILIGNTRHMVMDVGLCSFSTVLLKASAVA